MESSLLDPGLPTHNGHVAEASTVENLCRSSPETGLRQQLRDWINKLMRIEITDGRVLIGSFLCTDKDSNVILGACIEYLPSSFMEPNKQELACDPLGQDTTAKLVRVFETCGSTTVTHCFLVYRRIQIGAYSWCETCQMVGECTTLPRM